jgi:amidase
MDDLARQTSTLDAVGQAELVRSGQVSPQELIAAAISRIEAMDDGPNGINAVIHRRFERALTESADPDLADGLFRGVPMVLKDLWPSSAGDPLHLGNIAMKEAGYTHHEDSNITKRYRQAGMVIVGRSNTPEFGAVATTEPLAYGATRNPWNLGHSAGGSSGGAAAAVASGMLPAANASDGGGSIRIPAAACGLVGLKPSRGRISMGPLQDEWGVSVQHVVSVTVRDTAALLDISCGPFAGDALIAPPPLRPYTDEVGVEAKPLRIGLMSRPAAGPIDPECEAAAVAAAKWFETQGHTVEIAYPHALDWWAGERAGLLVWAVNMRNSIARVGSFLGRSVGSQDFEPSTWGLGEMADSYTALDLLQAQSAQTKLRRETAMWWESQPNGGSGFDLLLSPTAAIPTPELGDLVSTPDEPMKSLLKSTPLATFTAAWNTTGQPAISLPFTTSASGLPIGIQLVAAYGREDLLLRVASVMEADLRWDLRRAPHHASHS